MELTEDKSELIRKFIEWAVSAGRNYQSPQTGFVHYYYGYPSLALHQTIPIYENVLFALALLRSRQVENIKEAQNLLTRLFAFQSRDVNDLSHGNFPVYLHEFPHCRDYSAAIQLLAPLYFIWMGFRHILGEELRVVFKKSIENLVEYGLKADRERSFPYSIAIRFAAGMMAFGKLFEQENWINKGSERLKVLGDRAAQDSWCHTGHLTDVMVASQMVPQAFKEEQWNPFWKFVSDTWQAELGCYCGPSLQEKQDQFEPEVSLYDLYLGYFNGHVAARVFQKIRFVHLSGALIHSMLWKMDSALKIMQSSLLSETWTCIKKQDWALTLLEKTLPISEKREFAYTPFKMLWGDRRVTHSLVCQGCQAKKITYEWKDPFVEMIFELEENYESKMELAREISFYFDNHPAFKVTVEGRLTNTFELGQRVTLHLEKGKEIQLIFELLEGEGHFMGHLAQANRPSQIYQGLDKKPQVFDWVLFLRTIRRTEHCRLRLRVAFIVV